MFLGESRSLARARLLQTAAVLLLAVLGPACGGSKSGPPASPSFTASLTTPAGVQKGVVKISYTLFDPAGVTCTIAVDFSVNGGGTWQPATPAPGGDGLSSLASSPAGVPHVFFWNSLVDAVGTGSANPNVRIRITPTNTTASVTPAMTTNFTVDNTGNTPPSLAITPPAGTQSGLILVSYSLTDAESDPCSLQAWFSLDGGTTFSPATPGPGGDGMSGLASSPGGTAHTFLWNSVADGVALAGANSTVQVRLQPSDGSTGGATSTGNFSVDNTGKSSGTSLGGAYPIQVNGTSVSDWATSVATDGASLYVFGFEAFDFESTSGADSRWTLRKFLIATGAPVPAFGTSGTLTGNPGPGVDMPFKVVVDGGSLFLIMARETAAGSRSFVLRIEKRDAGTGVLVATFGSGGFLETSAPASFDGIPLPWTMALDGSFLYVAGSQQVSATDSQWRIEKRDRTTGQLIAGFGTGGRVDENPTGTADGCFSIVLGAASMWLVGTEGVDGTAVSNSRIRIEKRNLLDGGLDSGFGTGGIVTVDAGLGDDIGEDAVSDGTSLIVYSRVETANGSGLFRSRIEKRDLGTGALVGTAVPGTASDPSGELPFGHLALDGGNLFVCQTDGALDAQWIIEKRSSSTLSLVTSFGTSGVLAINPAVGGYDRPLGIVAVGGVVLVVGMDSVPSDEEWRIEARWR